MIALDFHYFEWSVISGSTAFQGDRPLSTQSGRKKMRPSGIHASTRARVSVGSYTERRKLNVITEYVEVAAQRFIESHEALMTREPFCGWSPLQLMRIEEPGSFNNTSPCHGFYFGATTNQPAKWLEWLYRTYQDDFDGVGARSSDRDTHLILTHILGMTPGEFIKRAYLDDDRPPIVPEDSFPVTPGDDEESPTVVPSDDIKPPIVPSDDYDD
jgi:hypothetical protein